MPLGLSPLGATRFSGPKEAGGPAKEKPSRVWDGSGVGAELRSELQSAECLKDSGPGGRILKNVLNIVALEVRC